MSKKKVLFVMQEIMPYVPETFMSRIGRTLPQKIQEKKREIRVFMPRYGIIKERRHQLHEVIRLSGMNIIVNDTDHSLVIKVASIPSARMQIYFIDNEEFFHRKAMLYDEEGNFFEDNDERIIFYSRGVLETVKKLRWSPDLMHVHGIIGALAPVYIKKAFQEDPLFKGVKVIYSIYNMDFDVKFNKNFAKKAVFDVIQKKDMPHLKGEPTIGDLVKQAIDYSDGVIIAEEEVPEEFLKYAEDQGKLVLNYVPEEKIPQEYSEFYDKVLASQNA